MQRDELIGIVKDSLRDVLESMEDSDISPDSIDDATILIGDGAVLDSMRVVSMIVDVEQRIEESQDVSITIADERAMNMKHSPFRTVGSLADYLRTLVEEQRK